MTIATGYGFDQQGLVKNFGLRQLWEKASVGTGRQIVTKLLGRFRPLLSLDAFLSNRNVIARRDTGIRLVKLNEIRGSMGRQQDFDRAFRPLRSHTVERWISVARVHQAGRTLPPVELVQIENTYFVVDGHHRISVAAAHGQETIEAHVVVWTVAEPTPAIQLTPCFC